MKNTLKMFAVVILLFLSSFALADEASHQKAVEDLMTIMNMSGVMSETIDRTVQAMIGQNPEIAPASKNITAFFQKYLSWEATKKDVIPLWKQSFTEDELKELIKFYQTPIGQKTVKVLPTLSAKGSELGQKLVTEHMPELLQQLSQILPAGGTNATPEKQP